MTASNAQRYEIWIPGELPSPDPNLFNPVKDDLINFMNKILDADWTTPENLMLWHCWSVMQCIGVRRASVFESMFHDSLRFVDFVLVHGSTEEEQRQELLAASICLLLSHHKKPEYLKKAKALGFSKGRAIRMLKDLSSTGLYMPFSEQDAEHPFNYLALQTVMQKVDNYVEENEINEEDDEEDDEGIFLSLNIQELNKKTLLN